MIAIADIVVSPAWYYGSPNPLDLVTNYLVNLVVIALAYLLLRGAEVGNRRSVLSHVGLITLGGYALDLFALHLAGFIPPPRNPFWRLGCLVGMALLLYGYNYSLARHVYRKGEQTASVIALAIAAITNPFYLL